MTENTKDSSGSSEGQAQNDSLSQPSRRKFEEKDLSLQGSGHSKNDFFVDFAQKLIARLSIIEENITKVREGLLGEINAKQRNVLETANQNVTALCQMVFDLQNISSIEAGQATLQKQQVDIVEFVGKVHADLDSKIKEKGLDWRESLSTPNVSVFLDPERIRQVLTYLFEYMIRYAAPGPLEFRVKEKDDAIECWILNPGSRGFSGELDRLFDKLHAPPEKAEIPDDEVGLSLALCKGIMELHKGRIWAENTAAGDGFGFTLPKISVRDLFSEIVEESAKTSAQNNTDLSILFLRVHLFEHMNPRESQQCVNMIIQAIQKTIRAGRDKVVGGDKTFLIFLPHTRKWGVPRAIERLKKSLIAVAGLNPADIHFKSASFFEDGTTATELLEKLGF